MCVLNMSAIDALVQTQTAFAVIVCLLSVSTLHDAPPSTPETFVSQ